MTRRPPGSDGNPPRYIQVQSVNGSVNAWRCECSRRLTLQVRHCLSLFEGCRSLVVQLTSAMPLGLARGVSKTSSQTAVIMEERRGP